MSSEYAIYYAGSSMVARTPDGAYHIYTSSEQAEAAAQRLGPGYEVRPWGDSQEE